MSFQAWKGLFADLPEERLAALDGLRGIFVLLFFLFSFFAQFDPAKIGRIAGSHAQTVLAALDVLMAPCLAARELPFVLAGYFLGRSEPPALGAYARGRFLRLAPAALATMVPMLAYTGADLGRALGCLAFYDSPEGGPRFAGLLFLVIWGCAGWVVLGALLRRLGFGVRLALYCVGLLALFSPGADFGRAMAWAGVSVPSLADSGPAGACPGLLMLGLAVGLAAGRWGRGLPDATARPGAWVWLGAFTLLAWLDAFAPAGALMPARQAVLALAVIRLADHARDKAARVLAGGVPRFFGVTAYSFFLVHTTWGMRLSRSLLQSTMQGVAMIGLHFVLSLVLATAAGAFFWRLFERPALLRKAPPAAKDDGLQTQGARL